MKTRIVLPIALVASALALLGAVPAFADTPGVSPTCFPQTQNPHPPAPVGQTTDVLFCTSTGTNGGTGGAGSGAGGSGGTGGANSGGAGSHGSGQTGASTTTAGTTGAAAPASLTSSAAQTNSGDSAKPSSTPVSGPFGGLVAFLGATSGMAVLFGFLLLLAIALFIIAVVGWLRRRDATGWGTRFARVTHRA